MKSIQIDGSVGQKLAAHSLTQTLADEFKLHPHTIARDIIEGSKKVKVSEDELFQFLKTNLPLMVISCLEETEVILKKMLEKNAKKN